VNQRRAWPSGVEQSCRVAPRQRHLGDRNLGQVVVGHVHEPDGLADAGRPGVS
jgi:hypothetical protein